MIMTAFAAAATIMLLAASAVTSVQAYLSAATDSVDNEFAPMTYTNTHITETGESGGKYTITSSGSGTKTYTVTKTAAATNDTGGDKKPVFVRMTYTLSIYDGNGVNVTPSHDYATAVVGLETYYDSSKWTKDGNYYYYNGILLPGDSTPDLFNAQGVKFTSDKALTDMTVKVNVIVDTVQAISTDSGLWTAKDFSTTEVVQAWGKTPALPDVAGRPETQTAVTVSGWS